MTLQTFRAQLKPFVRWVPAGVMLLLSLSYLFNLVYQIRVLQTAQNQREERIVELRNDERNLLEWRRTLDYIKTDYFTERYARTQLRMGKQGETLVFPQVFVSSSSSPTNLGVGATKQKMLWWNDFVD
jgi:hypothetical protein